MASGNSKANQHKNTLRKNGKGARGRFFKLYSSEERNWHNKLARLARHFAKSGLAAYARAYESVMARSPITVRNKYKEHTLT